MTSHIGTLLMTMCLWGTLLYELWRNKGDDVMVEFLPEVEGVQSAIDTNSGITKVSLLLF